MSIKIKIQRRRAIRGYHILGGAGFMTVMCAAGYLEASNSISTMLLFPVIGMIGVGMILASIKWEREDARRTQIRIREHKENIMRLFEEGLNWTI